MCFKSSIIPNDGGLKSVKELKTVWVKFLKKKIKRIKQLLEFLNQIWKKKNNMSIWESVFFSSWMPHRVGNSQGRFKNYSCEVSSLGWNANMAFVIIKYWHKIRTHDKSEHVNSSIILLVVSVMVDLPSSSVTRRPMLQELIYHSTEMILCGISYFSTLEHIQF